VTIDDLQWARYIVKAVLQNEAVQAYLEWLKTPEQIPDHSDFSDALYLYASLFGKDDVHYQRISGYLSVESKRLSRAQPIEI